jgi:hypothetical protein
VNHHQPDTRILCDSNHSFTSGSSMPAFPEEGCDARHPGT